MGQHANKVDWPFTRRFARHTKIGNRTEQRSKQRDADQQRIHVSTTGEVLIR